jgi:hypothetical protein
MTWVVVFLIAWVAIGLLMSLASRSWERSIKQGREHRREVERRIEMMERGMVSSRKLPTDEAPHQNIRPIRQG